MVTEKKPLKSQQGCYWDEFTVISEFYHKQNPLGLTDIYFFMFFSVRNYLRIKFAARYPEIEY